MEYYFSYSFFVLTQSYFLNLEPFFEIFEPLEVNQMPYHNLHIEN